MEFKVLEVVMKKFEDLEVWKLSYDLGQKLGRVFMIKASTTMDLGIK